MTQTGRRFAIRRLDADRVLEEYLASLEERSAHTRAVERWTIRQFLTDHSIPPQAPHRRLMLDGPRLLEWMIRDFASRPEQGAYARFLALKQYLQKLLRVGLVDIDFLAALRAEHGFQSWVDLLHALRSPNAAIRFAPGPARAVTAAWHAEVAMAQAERALNQMLRTLQSRGNHNLHRRTIRTLFSALGEPRQIPNQRVVFDEKRLVRWLIHYVAARTDSSACHGLTILGCYLQALVKAGLLASNPMAELRARHGQPKLIWMVKALRAGQPQRALARLGTNLPPPGPLSQPLRDYVELHRSLGKKYGHDWRMLTHLDHFLQAQGIITLAAITRATVEQWLATLPCGPMARGRYAQCAHRLFRHLQNLNLVTENPFTAALFDAPALPAKTFRPFIFTKEQLADILAAAQQLPRSRSFPLRAPVLHAMLTLACALGLRSGEIRRLQIQDLDLQRNTLFIRETKFHKSRLVAFGPKLSQYLQLYLAVRRRVFSPWRGTDPLFVTMWRTPVGVIFLTATFRKIVTALGITGHPGQLGPRLHDVRHSFAVNRLLRWYREGVDVQSRLPMLSTFLGHIGPRSTEVYLTITAELLHEANTRFHRYGGHLVDQDLQS